VAAKVEEVRYAVTNAVTATMNMRYIHADV